jgi:imidazolonepropionase-like amidohydrolase
VVRKSFGAVVAAFCAGIATSVVSAADAPPDVAINDVTIISPERAAPLEHAYVHIVYGRIAAVSTQKIKAPLQINGKGKFLIPGLIDTHTHIGWVAGMNDAQLAAHQDIVKAAQAQEPRSFLYFGYTTVLALGETSKGVKAWNALDVRPDAYFCGRTPMAKGYAFFSFDEGNYFLYLPQQAEQIPKSINKAEHTPKAVVDKMLADGAICVKTYFERGFGPNTKLPVPTLGMIKELVAAAHEKGLPVFMHANNKEAQQFALDAGVDVMAHGMFKGHDLSPGGDLSADVRNMLDTVVKRGMGYQPTMQVFGALRAELDDNFFKDSHLADAYVPALLAWHKTDEAHWYRKSLSDVPVQFLDSRLQATGAVVRYLAVNHARLLFGTDTPSDDVYGNPPGLNGLYEMRRWVDNGVSLQQLFSAATIENAKVMKLEKEIGTVEAGKRANLLLVTKDPLKTVDAYDAIDTVFIGGKPIARKGLSAKNAAR